MRVDCHTVIVGGGSAGSVIATRLAERGVDVVLVEAGPDYGERAGGRWPAELLEYRTVPSTHDWGLWSAPRPAGGQLPLAIGRVIGGSSARNPCGWSWGRASDWPEWQRAGGEAWSVGALQAATSRVESDHEGAGDWHGREGPVRVTRFPDHPLVPFFDALADTAPGHGLPWLDDTNDPFAEVGIGRTVWNVAERVRWNASFAWLDRVRGLPNLRIIDRTLVDRLILEGDRARGVRAMGPGGDELEIRAERVILSAGAYHSPGILLRSGIGPADDLEALGIEPVLDHPGVGANLMDHAVVPMRFLATPAGMRAGQDYVASELPPRAQLEVRARSSRSEQRCDLHLSFPAGGPVPDGWEFVVRVEVFRPASRGRVRLGSPDPAALPLVDHRYLSDPDDLDLAIVHEGVALARSLLAAGPMRRHVAHERWPGPLVPDQRLDDFARANVYTFHHPSGTCRMGPADDPAAVVDGRGQVHGIGNLFVADASIMPALPSALPNATCMAIGEVIAGQLTGIEPAGAGSTTA